MCTLAQGGASIHPVRQWVPAIIWAAVIWCFSTQLFSAANTSRFIFPMIQWLFPGASLATLELLQLEIRKAAHFTEYFIFGLLLLRGIRGGRRGWKLGWALVALAMAACWATLDEVHQLYVPGRSGSPFDSLLDCSAALAAQLLAWLHIQWRSWSTHTERV